MGVETFVVADEDKVVQLLMENVPFEGDFIEAWIDCGPGRTVEEMRKMFPDSEYREIVVTDAIAEYDESVTQEFLTPEDEIDFLKQQVIDLQAKLARLGQNSTESV